MGLTCTKHDVTALHLHPFSPSLAPAASPCETMPLLVALFRFLCSPLLTGNADELLQDHALPPKQAAGAFQRACRLRTR